MKIPQPTISDELKKFILRMKNNEATGTDHLQNFNYGGNYLKKQCDRNCDQSARERRKAIKMEEMDYLSVV